MRLTWNVNTLKALGRDLLDLQWLGSGVQRMQGDSTTCSQWKLIKWRKHFRIEIAL